MILKIIRAKLIYGKERTQPLEWEQLVPILKSLSEIGIWPDIELVEIETETARLWNGSPKID